MSTTQTIPVDSVRPAKKNPARALRYYYTGAALMLLVLMFLGFQQFYLHGRAFPNRPLAPPIKGMIILHGVTMTMWIFLLVAQTMLIANRKHALHKTLGKFGAVLAILIFFSGFKLAIESSRIAPPEAMLWGLNFKQFMAVPIITILLFGGFVLTGVLKRKKPAIHRPMMLLASITAVGAAVDRIPAVTSLYSSNILGTLFGPFAYVVIFGLLLMVAHVALTRKFDKNFAIGWTVSVMLGLAFFQLAHTSAWDPVANFLLMF